MRVLVKTVLLAVVLPNICWAIEPAKISEIQKPATSLNSANYKCRFERGNGDAMTGADLFRAVSDDGTTWHSLMNINGHDVALNTVQRKFPSKEGNGGSWTLEGLNLGIEFSVVLKKVSPESGLFQGKLKVTGSGTKEIDIHGTCGS